MPTGGEARGTDGSTARCSGCVRSPSRTELAPRGGCWFVGIGGTAIHLSVDQRFLAGAARPIPALIVVNLEAARQALEAAGARVVDDESGLPVRRCYTHDPFGNRIELVEAGDAGFSERG